MLKKLTLKIKRQENFFYFCLYRLAKSVSHFSIPSIKPVHFPLYCCDKVIRRFFKKLVQGVWSIPLFKARCEVVGKGLKLPDGIPLVTGNHLKIYLGKNVSIGRSTIGASKVFDEPLLRIGDNTSIGYGTTISVAKEVVIGNDCMVSFNCLIMDNDDHPVDPDKRLARQPVDKKDIQPVRIGNNVWVGAHSAILKGVTIGDNSIISTHSLVTTNVPANSIYGGVPARLIKKDINNK